MMIQPSQFCVREGEQQRRMGCITSQQQHTAVSNPERRLGLPPSQSMKELFHVIFLEDVKFQNDKELRNVSKVLSGIHHIIK